MGGRGGRGLRDRRDVPVRAARRCWPRRRSGRPGSRRSSRWRSTAIRRRARAGRRRRRAGGSPTPARRSSGSTASAARRRCCRCCGRSARRSTCPSRRCPVPYHTHGAEPTFQSLGGGAAFPIALDPFTSTRHDVADFARAALEIGVEYLGLCCGAAPAPHPRDGRGDGPPPAREPLLARHVQARLPRLRPEPAGRQPRVRGAALAVYRYAVIGGGGIGSAAAYWLSRRAGDEVLCLEQWELGHGQGASEDHSRIIRLGYHSPAYTALTPSAYAAWREVEAESGVPLVHVTGMVNIARRGSEGVRDPRRLHGRDGRGRHRLRALRRRRADAALAAVPRARGPRGAVPARRRHPRHPQGGRGARRARARARRDRARRRGRDGDRAAARRRPADHRGGRVRGREGGHLRGRVDARAAARPRRRLADPADPGAGDLLRDAQPRRLRAGPLPDLALARRRRRRVLRLPRLRRGRDEGGAGPRRAGGERGGAPVAAGPRAGAAGGALRGGDPPGLHGPGAVHALLPLRHAAGPRLRRRPRAGAPAASRSASARGTRRSSPACSAASSRELAIDGATAFPIEAFRADRPALADPGYTPGYRLGGVAAAT